MLCKFAIAISVNMGSANVSSVDMFSAILITMYVIIVVIWVLCGQ